MKNRIVISLLAGTLALGACNLDVRGEKRCVSKFGRSENI